MKKVLQTCYLPLLLGLFHLSASAVEYEPYAPNYGELQVVQVDPTPEPNDVKVYISYPQFGELKNSAPINIQMRLEGYPLGIDTAVPRENEIWNDPEGQSLHIFIDNLPYFSVNSSLMDSLDNNEQYFNQTYDIDIPYNLQPGMHVIRVFPVRSFNESLKGDRCFAASIFYYKSKKNDLKVDLHQPYLTYNEPQGEYDFGPRTPILLDFYVTNCQLSKDGFKVQLYIDGKKERVLQSWAPYYIYGLRKGTHKIRLQLLDPQNKQVPGMFNDVEQSFVIK